MGNLHGSAAEVREYFAPFVAFVDALMKADRATGPPWPSEVVKKSVTLRIEIEAWLDEHAWLETLPLVLERTANGG